MRAHLRQGDVDGIFGPRYRDARVRNGEEMVG